MKKNEMMNMHRVGHGKEQVDGEKKDL